MKRVLIVDDNSTNLYMLETLLKGCGLEVTTALNGQHALDQARLHPPDLAVSDILMPVMDGYTLCRIWKEDERLRRIPFIVYTATYTEPEDEKLALSLGADRFLLKPLEPEKLMAILNEFLEKNEAAAAEPVRPLGDEMEFFRQYNEVLFKKLEKKMTDLDIANQKLRILEERYRLSFENVTDIVCTIDTDLKIQNVSPSVLRILGYTPQELVGRSMAELGEMLTPESFQRGLTDLNRTLRGETIPAVTYQFVARDGKKKFGEVSGSPIVRAGRTIGGIFIIRDVTDRKRAEKELEESRNMLIRSEKLAAIGQLSAGVAHEILNPLQIMSGKLELLGLNKGLSQKTVEAIRICQDQIQKVRKISGDLQQFARISEKQIAPCDVNALLDQVCSLMTPRLKMEGVKVKAHYQTDLPLVPMDRDRIGQVIMNLINNAADAMKSNGAAERVLRIASELEGGHLLRVSFSDSGPGIPDEVLNMIFNPFFTTKEPGKGTGLGLSISYGIIQDHGGRIWAGNNEQGGATFCFELPTRQIPCP